MFDYPRQPAAHITSMHGCAVPNSVRQCAERFMPSAKICRCGSLLWPPGTLLFLAIPFRREGIATEPALDAALERDHEAAPARWMLPESDSTKLDWEMPVKLQANSEVRQASQ